MIKIYWQCVIFFFFWEFSNVLQNPSGCLLKYEEHYTTIPMREIWILNQSMISVLKSLTFLFCTTFFEVMIYFSVFADRNGSQSWPWDICLCGSSVVWSSDGYSSMPGLCSCTLNISIVYSPEKGNLPVQRPAISSWGKFMILTKKWKW